MRMLTVCAVSLALLTQGAAAKPPLREVAKIDDGLLAVALADEIRKKCDAISPRMLVALSTLNSLKREARALGYSDHEIEAYVSSQDEKARMRARGEAYVRNAGLNPKKPADLCTLGRAEIAKGSQIGALLKVK